MRPTCPMAPADRTCSPPSRTCRRRYRASTICGSIPPIKGASRTGWSRRSGGRSRWSAAPAAGAGWRPARSRPRCRGASRCFRAGGWWREPSQSTYNPLLTSKCLPPMIGRAGLLKLRTVVSRLRAAQQECACGPQEAGVPCPSSPPNQSLPPVLPPALGDSGAQLLGPVATDQSATAPAGTRSSRRTATGPRGPVANRQQRGGRG